MSDLSHLSEFEKAQLKKTILDIIHLFIGDLITPAKEDRDKLWLQATVDAGIFESRAYWIRKELKTGYTTPVPAHLGQSLFYYNREGHFAEFLTYLVVAFAVRNDSVDYSQKARELLGYLDIEYGLIDKKLEYLTLYEVIEMILLAPKVWDDGDPEKK